MRQLASTRAPATSAPPPVPDGPVSIVERIACWSVRHRKAAVLGWLADQTSITFVYKVCAFLPAIGLLTAFLPNIGGDKHAIPVVDPEP